MLSLSKSPGPLSRHFIVLLPLCHIQLGNVAHKWISCTHKEMFKGDGSGCSQVAHTSDFVLCKLS